MGFLNSELAYLAGKVMGDGNLDKTNIVRIISKSRRDLIKLSRYINKTFNIPLNKISITKRIKSYSPSYLLQVNCTILGKKLSSLSIPSGNKTKNIFLIPPFVLKNKLSRKRFLQAILEDELTTIKIEKSNYSVKPQFKMAKVEELLHYHLIFMKQIKSMIESFSVKCSDIRKIRSNKLAKTWDLYFCIHRNKENIIRFKENIGFRLNKNKIKELNKCYQILKKTLRQTIDKDKIYTLRRQGFSMRKIAYQLGIGKSMVHRILNSKTT